MEGDRKHHELDRHIPYPQALQSKSKKDPNLEILAMFMQVKIIIPLLDVIRQVPSYACFLKDLCIVKRKMSV